MIKVCSRFRDEPGPKNQASSQEKRETRDERRKTRADKNKNKKDKVSVTIPATPLVLYHSRRRDVKIYMTFVQSRVLPDEAFFAPVEQL